MSYESTLITVVIDLNTREPITPGEKYGHMPLHEGAKRPMVFIDFTADGEPQHQVLGEVWVRKGTLAVKVDPETAELPIGEGGVEYRIEEPNHLSRTTAPWEHLTTDIITNSSIILRRDKPNGEIREIYRFDRKPVGSIVKRVWQSSYPWPQKTS